MSNRPAAAIFCAKPPGRVSWRVTVLSRRLLLLALSLSACHRAEIELDVDDEVEPQGGAAGANMVAPSFSGHEPGSAAVGVGSAIVSPAFVACLQTLEPLQAECVFLGRAVCERAPLAGQSRACEAGCAVCEATVADYPYYFEWHRCCEPADCAEGAEPSLCDERCPAPTEHDKVAPCALPDPRIEP
jgi:hypothetical protein